MHYRVMGCLCREEKEGEGEEGEEVKGNKYREAEHMLGKALWYVSSGTCMMRT